MKKTLLYIVGIISILSFLSFLPLPCEARVPFKNSGNVNAGAFSFTNNKTTATPMAQFGRYRPDIPPEMQTEQGGGAVIIVILLILGIAGGGAFFYMKKKAASKTDDEFDDLDMDD